MLQLNDLTYRLGARLLLDKGSAMMPTGARVGFVGRNGTGKTTLFRLIAGDIAPEDGIVTMPRGTRLGRVEQEAPGGPQSLLDFVLAADVERAALLAEAESATDPARIADIQLRLVDIDAHAAPARAAAILHGLGFDAEAQDRPCSDFSGGWRMRVALAAVLFSAPDLLLLDEPTNYLDLEGALWLQTYLARYPHTMLVISHDRDFLDVVADHILHLENGGLALYRGNYSNFERQYAEKAELLRKESVKVEAERKHLQAFVDRFRAKASKATQAQSRIKRLAKLSPVALVRREDGVDLRLPSPERQLSSPLIALDGVSVGYGERTVLRHLSLNVENDDRIGLLGSNGNGKSTFVKLLGRRLEAMTGNVRRSEKLKVAFFAQHQLDELPEGETPVTLVRARMQDAPEAKVRARAAQLGFPAAKADTVVAKLSGGEKARLLLGLAAFDGPHLLILDEPTNHLDIDARAALVEAISDYEGAVIIVSHDRFLIDATCERLWLVKDGTVRPFEGDLDDYARLVVGGEPARAARPAAGDGPRQGGEQRRATAERRQDLVPMKRRIADLDAEIARLGGLLQRVDRALADPDTFRRDAAKAAKLSADRATLAARIASLEEEWLRLSSDYEAAVA